MLRVKFTKIGNRIKYELPVKMYCTEMQTELPNSGTLDKTDCLYKVWLGDVDKVFKKTNVIYKKVFIYQLYDPCDIPMTK